MAHRPRTGDSQRVDSLGISSEQFMVQSDCLPSVLLVWAPISAIFAPALLSKGDVERLRTATKAGVAITTDRLSAGSLCVHRRRYAATPPA
ncbi:MAG: hypothetical protein NZ553_05605 [Caldilinea sp.]|nr:hypothetical protein [Caldilinea sp.]MDW8439934.1 hypothetical protein [Caldilineaceae bacterium]